MNSIQFTEYFQLYNQPQELRANCNSLTVLNLGTSIAILEGLEILPGDQYISPGNDYEFNETRYRLSFDNTGTNKVLTIRKIYR
jgi:hypothetical protein